MTFDAAAALPNFPRTASALQKGYENGQHVGAQIYVSRGGAIVADAAMGLARPETPMRNDTMQIWMSCTKPITALALARLWERGEVEFNGTVGHIIPEFAQNGKGNVTIRHLLTHTSGFRFIGAKWTTEPWEEVLPQIYAAPLDAGWVPGQKAGYHPASSWYVLGEVIQRVTGEPFSKWMRTDVFEPLGLARCTLGMTAEEYDKNRDSIAVMHTMTPNGAAPMADARGHALAVRPGATAFGPANQLAKVYEMLLRGGVAEDGSQFLNPKTVRTFTSRQRAGMRDITFQSVVDWGLGFILNSIHHGVRPWSYGFGEYASHDAFGHGGAESSVCIADPAHQVAIVWICNGMPGDKIHNARNWALNSAIYEDLGLTSAATGGLRE